MSASIITTKGAPSILELRLSYLTCSAAPVRAADIPESCLIHPEHRGLAERDGLAIHVLQCMFCRDGCSVT